MTGLIRLIQKKRNSFSAMLCEIISSTEGNNYFVCPLLPPGQTKVEKDAWKEDAILTCTPNGQSVVWFTQMSNTYDTLPARGGDI